MQLHNAMLNLKRNIFENYFLTDQNLKTHNHNPSTLFLHTRRSLCLVMEQQSLLEFEYWYR